MYIDILIIIINFPYSTCIRSFFGSSILIVYSLHTYTLFKCSLSYAIYVHLKYNATFCKVFARLCISDKDMCHTLWLRLASGFVRVAYCDAFCQMCHNSTNAPHFHQKKCHNSTNAPHFDKKLPRFDKCNTFSHKKLPQFYKHTTFSL